MTQSSDLFTKFLMLRLLTSAPTHLSTYSCCSKLADNQAWLCVDLISQVNSLDIANLSVSETLHTSLIDLSQSLLLFSSSLRIQSTLIFKIRFACEEIPLTLHFKVCNFLNLPVVESVPWFVSRRNVYPVISFRFTDIYIK